ncbi:MAG: hypothetical protein HYS07_01185 [Chlamydiae bacterium]|nr:hypothetical protein [Chlamydiota bacterium]MBI3276534.1 hypothetical protein [Chlamydiota bacterium]
MKVVASVLLVLALVLVAVQKAPAPTAVERKASKPPEITYFIGLIEIIYPKGPRLVLKTGENAPLLEAGTVIKVLEGKLSLSIWTSEGNQNVQTYERGAIIRITESQNGNWIASSNGSSTSPAVSNTNLNNSFDPNNSESEIVLEEEEEEETEVSPS